MASVHIYYNEAVQEVKNFKNTCWLIWDDVSGLSCLVDRESDKKNGFFMSTVHYASTDPELVAVFPEWELRINDVPQPQGFYESVEGINGKTVKLRYKDYECVLDFTNQ